LLTILSSDQESPENEFFEKRFLRRLIKKGKTSEMHDTVNHLQNNLLPLPAISWPLKFLSFTLMLFKYWVSLKQR